MHYILGVVCTTIKLSTIFTGKPRIHFITHIVNALQEEDINNKKNSGLWLKKCQ